MTPAEIAASCIEAARAGAAIVHIHVRDPATGEGSRDPRLFKEVCDRVRDSGTEVLINLTGGLGARYIPDPANEGQAAPGSDVASVDERMAHLELCRPGVWGALGIGRDEMPVVAQSAVLGGSIRVGLENNLYKRKGEFATNGELVTQARGIVEAMGYDLAGPADARRILAL